MRIAVDIIYAHCCRQAGVNERNNERIKREIFVYLRNHETESAMKLIDYAYEHQPDWIQFLKENPDVLYDIRLFIEQVQNEYETDVLCANIKYPSYTDVFDRVSKKGRITHKPYREMFGKGFTGIKEIHEPELAVRKVFYNNVPEWRKEMHKKYPNDFPIQDSELFEKEGIKDSQYEINLDEGQKGSV